MRITPPSPSIVLDYPLEYASMVRASKGWTPETLYAMPFEDFLTWRDAFGRLAELERQAMESHPER